MKGIKDFCTHTRFHAYTPTRTHALTLIELVIVCAIIAVLAGIVWVVMAPAREKARMTTCVSNLRQIGLAYQMYRQDWDGIDPEEGKQLKWWELGLPKGGCVQLRWLGYLKDDRLLFCPNWTRDPFLTSDGPPVSTSYRTMYGPDEDTLPEANPFSWIISQMPDFPIEICVLHDHNYLAGDLRNYEKVLGITVTGDVQWYSQMFLKRYWFK